MTEIYDYLRLLFARVGRTYSPISGRLVKKDDVTDVVNAIADGTAGDKVLLLTTFKQHKNRQPREELNILLQKGFSRLYVGGETLRIEDLLEMDDAALKKKLPPPGPKARSCLYPGRPPRRQGPLTKTTGTALPTRSLPPFMKGKATCWWKSMATASCRSRIVSSWMDLSFEEPVPNLFSFNNPFGACPTCEGFSQVLGIDPDLVIPDKRLSVYEGAIAPWKGEKLVWWRDQFVKAAKKFDFPDS